MKTALTIAGSDSSGGAGIQADLKTMTANGVYAMSAITALTAQNTTGVQGIFEVSPEFLKLQIDSVFTDIRPDAVKIGMVSSAGLIQAIAEKLNEYKAENIVVDPVMVATSGAKLISDDAIGTLKEFLFPLATVLTPNIPEAVVLSGMEITTAEEMMEAAKKISETYHCAVLLKGGHQLNDANDLLYRDGGYRWFNGRRIDNPNTHGTGCTLSSAIASNLAKGYDLDTAVEQAKAYISGALAAMLDLGAGSGPMTERLLSSVQEIWAGYHTHPFVMGIGDGSLDQEKFRYYMIQDYLYLIDYTRVFAVGVAKAKDLSVMKLFAASTHTILDGEMDIHRTYMKRLGISLDEAENTPVALDNRSYTSYMLRASYEGGEAQVMAAILSCALSYEAIAKEILKKNPEADRHPFYGEWVSGYASAEYHMENERLTSLMNRLTADYTPAQIERLIDIFTACSRYEMSFWDMAWEMRR